MEQNIWREKDDIGWDIQRTRDDEYIIVGETDSFGSGWKDIWLIKIDEDGNEKYNKTFGDESADWAYCVDECKDGGYILIGSKLIKTDVNGNKEWSKRTSGNYIQQTSDRGYVITTGGRVFFSDVSLLKIDNKGEMEWSKTFGGDGGDGGLCVQQTSDNGYIIIGFTASFGAGYFDAWLVKTDSEGNKQWDKTFGGPEDDIGYSIYQTRDDGYIIAVSANEYSSRQEGWLIKTDGNGNMIWRQTLEGFLPFCVRPTSDDGFITVGVTLNGNDICLVKIASEDAPDNPTINGPISGKAGVEYEYTFTSSDPNGDNLYYYIDWGDNTNTGWLGPYPSGESVMITHMWEKEGFYTIKAKAKDINGIESGWSILEISMPKKNKYLLVDNPFFSTAWAFYPGWTLWIFNICKNC